jgi:hypothetical protein
MPLPDLYSQWTQARQNGAQRANDYTVRQNIGGALQGDSGALSAILKASPQTGMQLQDRAAGQQKAALAQQQEDSGRAALMFSQTGDPQYYAAWRQSLAGLPNAPQLPEALEPDDLEPAKQSAGAYAQAYGGFKGMETPSAIRELQMLQANPELAKLDMQRRQAGFGRPQLIQTADGYAWATPEGASPLNYGGGQPQTPQGPQSGQPFTIDPSLPPNVQAAIRSNEQAWANAPDQATAMLPPTRAQGPRVMPAPKQTAQSELEKRLALADQMGASPEEKRRMVIGREGAAAGAKPMPVGALKEMLSIEDSLGSTKLVADTLAKHASKIQSGDLSVSPVNAIGARVRETFGAANTNDVNLREFKADITRTVNEWLRLNKGVQTEGDAQREYKAIMDSNDPVVVARSIERLSKIMKNTVEIQVRKREAIQRNYGQGGQTARSASQPSQQPVKRARNPQTGETLVLVNGQWVPE